MTEPKVLLFLGEGFEDLEAVAVLAVCGWTEYREYLPTVRVVTTGLREEVRGRFGLRIRPDLPLEAVMPQDYAALAVPGGFHSRGYDEAYDDRLYAVARAIHAQGGTIATMCVGSLPIAEAGLLRGRTATTYQLSRRDNVARLRELGGIPTANPVEVCDRIISCAGPAQAIEVAFRLLESLVGPDAAAEVRRHLDGSRVQPP